MVGLKYHYCQIQTNQYLIRVISLFLWLFLNIRMQGKTYQRWNGQSKFVMCLIVYVIYSLVYLYLTKHSYDQFATFYIFHYSFYSLSENGKTLQKILKEDDLYNFKYRYTARINDFYKYLNKTKTLKNALKFIWKPHRWKPHCSNNKRLSSTGR